VDDLKGRQELYNGFGNSLSRAIELVMTPLLFGLLGLLLDHVFGITPVLTIAMVLFAIAGLAVRMYYGYSEEMRAHEANAPWARNRP
jgi:hypothetical protein